LGLRAWVLRPTVPVLPEEIFVFEVAVGQVVVILGVGVGIRGESLVDVPRFPFRESIREHFEAVLSDV
jgi:hypothetical protein